MKTNYWLVLGTMLATSAVAQVNTNKLPEIPAPVVAAPTVAAVAPATTNMIAAPKKAAPVKHKKKAVAKPVAKTTAAPAEKKTAEPAAVLAPLVAGPAVVAVANLNLRGQAGLKGEVVGHAKKGDAITVLAVITLDKHKTDEPAAWAKIALPTGTKVWVNSKFVNATNNTVSAKKLNLRGGPSENYSVLGALEKGAPITPVITKNDWIQIETPTNAFAFVSAAFLKQEAPAVVPPVVPVVEPLPVTTNTVPEPQPIISQPPPVVPVVPTPVVPAVETNAAPVVDTNPPPPRVVSHEGFVRPSVSVVAPTFFELYDPTTGNAINYLYTTSTNLNVARYNGLQIIVTGEEGMEPRWQDTPVLTIQKIYVLSTNTPVLKPVPVAKSAPEVVSPSGSPKNRGR